MRCDRETISKLIKLQQTLHFEDPSEAELELNNLISELTVMDDEEEAEDEDEFDIDDLLDSFYDD